MAPRLLVPETLKSTTSVSAPSRSRLPVMVRSCEPVPVTVLPKLTVVAVNVRSPPESVVAPVYVCVPEVVTLAPKFEVPETLMEVVLAMAASKSKLPVMVIASKSLLLPTRPSKRMVPVVPLVPMHSLSQVTST